MLAGLLDAYAEPEMLDAMHRLEAWAREHGDRLGDEFRRRRIDDYDSVRELDHARRRVSHHFQKIHTMWRGAGLITENTVRAAATVGQVRLYRQFVEPLEWAVNSDYVRSSFEDLGCLYGIARWEPPMASPRQSAQGPPRQAGG